MRSRDRGDRAALVGPARRFDGGRAAARADLHPVPRRSHDRFPGSGFGGLSSRRVTSRFGRVDLSFTRQSLHPSRSPLNDLATGAERQPRTMGIRTRGRRFRDAGPRAGLAADGTRSRSAPHEHARARFRNDSRDHRRRSALGRRERQHPQAGHTMNHITTDHTGIVSVGKNAVALARPAREGMAGEQLASGIGNEFRDVDVRK